MKRLFVISAIFAAHFSLTWSSLARQAVIDHSMVSPFWNLMAYVVRFPLMIFTLPDKFYDFPGSLMLFNSISFTAFVTFILRMSKKKSSKVLK